MHVKANIYLVFAGAIHLRNSLPYSCSAIIA